MTDRNTISQVIESLFEDWIDKNINVHPLAVENMRILEADALSLPKEQPEIVRCRDCKNNNQCAIQFRFADADNPGNWFCAHGKQEGR